MELQKYKSILNKYYEGCSTIAEEQQLKHFLETYTGNDSDLTEAKVFFGFVSIESNETVNIDFETIIQAKPKTRVRKIYAYTTAVAASIIIALLFTVLMNTNSQPIVYAYINGQPVTNKHEAIKYSQQALLSIQSNLNKGTQGLDYMNKLNKTVELLTVKN